MRPPADYKALRDLKVPGSAYAFAAREGDDITENARDNAGWVVGLDVEPLRDDVMERPADDAPRSTWQNYAVVRGVPYAEAADLDRKELQKRLETQPEEPPADAGAMPAESDLKAAWVEYAVTELTKADPAVDPEQVRTLANKRTKQELIDIFGANSDPHKQAAVLTGEQEG
jgi:hypothetical protein